MSRNVGRVVGKGTEGKRIFVQIMRLGDECENEIATPNIVREITKELAAEGIVAHVLNDGASIGIGVGLLQLLRSGAGKALQQQRLYTIGPGCIDDRFMREDGVACTTRNETGSGDEHSEDQRRHG